ncbi:MAG TPA: ATP-binding protein [Burkholderiales bacterium]|nr:ATP-binding protein [Burkholderiales bacterium]
MNPLPYLKSALAVLVVGVLAHQLTRFVPLPHVSVLFLAAVITSAALWGLGPSLFAAILSVAGGSFFFYTPIYSFHVANPQDFADLTVFVVVAVLTSRLSDGVRRQAREIAEARVRVKDEALRDALLNSVSHDLQTPLSAILGSATVLETLDERAGPQVRRELAATIREEAERLASYIGNVLDLSRIRGGHVSPRLELVELADIVNGALRRKERVLAGRRIDLSLPAGLPMLRLDIFLMEHALANVLDNAAKFSPPGSTIEIRAQAKEDAVVLEIADAGRGIRADDLPRIFDAFYRGRQADGGQSPGSGLGLAICRAFVEANGGRVGVRSDGEGRGARVEIRLPLAP